MEAGRDLVVVNGDVEIKVFQYEDPQTEAFCEKIAIEIEFAWGRLIKLNLEVALKIGQRLNLIKATLPHGQYGPWLEWRLPWARETARRWKNAAQRLDAMDSEQQKECWQILYQFTSDTAALEYLTLPPERQEKIRQDQAWGWNQFCASNWYHDLAEHLEDQQLGFARRCGDVYHAIQEIIKDNNATGPMKQRALQLYGERREDFAKLSGEDQEVVDRQIGAKKETHRAEEQELDRYVGKIHHEAWCQSAEGFWILQMGDPGQDLPAEKLMDLGFIRAIPVTQIVVLSEKDSPDQTMLAAFPGIDNRNTVGRAYSAAFKKAGMQRIQPPKMGGEDLE